VGCSGQREQSCRSDRGGGGLGTGPV